MLINIIFFITLIPATFLTMLWLSKEMVEAFKDLEKKKKMEVTK